ncbi:MAG: hypothetical protein ABL933_16145 [Methyloglobulus sp.]|nr:hypothetical protein [Methyloglobulus sp.]
MKGLTTIFSSTAADPKTNLPCVIKRLLILSRISGIALVISPLAFANPSGGQVVAGNAEIARQNARMDINQTSQRAVINWQNFNIDWGEHVNSLTGKLLVKPARPLRLYL